MPLAHVFHNIDSEDTIASQPFLNRVFRKRGLVLTEILHEPASKSCIFQDTVLCEMPGCVYPV